MNLYRQKMARQVVKNKRKQRWYCVAADKYFFQKIFLFRLLQVLKIHMKILLIKKWMIQLLIRKPPISDVLIINGVSYQFLLKRAYRLQGKKPA